MESPAGVLLDAGTDFVDVADDDEEEEEEDDDDDDDDDDDGGGRDVAPSRPAPLLGGAR
jgi:hypothetical protein